MRVNEIFYSVQGEGLFAGCPTIFVRLQGCNLRCGYCDTAYARDVDEKTEMTVKDVAKVVGGYDCRHVCITGGEPLTQEVQLGSFVNTIINQGQVDTKETIIEIETNGSIVHPEWWHRIDSWCLDVKCPSSGEKGSFKPGWAEYATRKTDQYKFVIDTQEDLDFVIDFKREFPWLRKNMLISPVIGREIDKKKLIWAVEFCKKTGLRLSVQLHKIVWDPAKRGV